MARLGVNIDHVATLRNQRDEGYPNIQRAAETCLESGAEQITIHLREDRRHIRDSDLNLVQNVTKKYGRLLNLEVGTDIEIAQIAGELCPDWVCIVPEKREEKTTEGGLNISNVEVASKVLEVAKIIRSSAPEVKISLFIEASHSVFEAVKKLNQLIKIDAVEIHTGDYAKHALDNMPINQHLDTFVEFKKLYSLEEIGYHAGHGLTIDSLKPLVKNTIFDEYNVGHWIISEAIFLGLEDVVRKTKKILSQ